MEKIAKELSSRLPNITICTGKSLSWSPSKQRITHPKDTGEPELMWGLIHEAAHAELGHTNFSSDLELLLLEVTAWHHAVYVAKELGQHIDPEHIQDCLDTYRDWLHQRSTCPRCSVVSMQDESRQYRCYNCHHSWAVSKSRLCRAYRRSIAVQKNRPEQSLQTIFE